MDIDLRRIGGVSADEAKVGCSQSVPDVFVGSSNANDTNVTSKGSCWPCQSMHASAERRDRRVCRWT